MPGPSTCPHQIVYATINDFVFFRTTPTLLSVIGTIVIMSSAMYVAVSVFPMARDLCAFWWMMALNRSSAVEERKWAAKDKGDHIIARPYIGARLTREPG